MNHTSKQGFGVFIRCVVRCENCNHQAVVSLEFRGARHRPLRCSKCGEADPIIEKVGQRI